jgi:siroheme synthase-like protein
MFINLQGAKVLMVGGGRIAARRTKTLLEFGATLHVVAPNLAPEMIKLLDTQTGIRWIREPYQPRHLEGAVLAIAATNQREVNRRIGQDARSRGIWVSVADQRQECTFYFPAIVRNDAFTAGLIANDGDHVSLRKTAARLRKAMQAEPERAQDVPIRKIENG